ncbi:hypothetical protein FF38_09062 [Lucilia cuprina]|uniref:Uncharacterized protein n=1 Tax=Lucilia cuprina TaxID=7375 RepID=A0A0L0BVA1_LUCCU|nr:hypothetical protein FF38_09062 [Lucilia cuprina]
MCSGLKVRDADALADPQKSLHWTCLNCKNENVEFYNLFKNSKDEFDKIYKEFISLQAKFVKFGKLFTKYQNLEKFSSSVNILTPKRRKTNSGDVVPHITYPHSSGLTSSSDINMNLPLGKINLNMNPSFPVEENVLRSENHPCSPMEFTTMNALALNTETACIPAISENLPVIQPTRASDSIHPLKVVLPKKTIFISSFAFDI